MSDPAASSPWSCKGPYDFIQVMNQRNPSVKVTDRLIWDKILVTRGNKDLGTLFLLRQCLQLWEDEMEKWGCNGLEEGLGQKLSNGQHLHVDTVLLQSSQTLAGI